jgi:hypothetical protein
VQGMSRHGVGKQNARAAGCRGSRSGGLQENQQEGTHYMKERMLGTEREVGQK